MAADDAFSLGDAPKKNIKDGLIVAVLSTLLGIFIAGEWLSIPMLCLFGSLAAVGLVMTIIGVVRVFIVGWHGQKKTGSGYNLLRHGWEKFLSHLKPKPVNDVPEIPQALIIVWFLGVFLGPAIGWLFTSNVIGSMTEKNWKYLLCIRVALSLPIPVIGGAYIIGRFLLRTRNWGAIAFFAVISLIGFAAGKASLFDLLQKEPAEIDTVIEAYRKKGYLKAPWWTSASRVDFGPHTARLKPAS